MNNKIYAFLCLMVSFGAPSTISAIPLAVALYQQCIPTIEIIAATGIPQDKEDTMKDLVKEMLLGTKKPQEVAKELVHNIIETIKNLEKNNGPEETINHLEEVKSLLDECSKTTGLFDIGAWIQLQYSKSCTALLSAEFFDEINKKFDNSTFIKRVTA